MRQRAGARRRRQRTARPACAASPKARGAQEALGLAGPCRAARRREARTTRARARAAAKGPRAPRPSRPRPAPHRRSGRDRARQRARRAACPHHAGAAGAARAGAPARAAASTCAAPSTATSRTAARRSTSPGGGARSSRCGSWCCSTPPARWSLYTAFFVRFLHGVVDAFREAEAFVFHTRLAHVSASLRDRDVSRAVDRLVA